MYEDDERYGGLIIGSPPFNVFAVFLVPFFICLKDEKRIRAINESFTKFIYAPIALIDTCIFAIFSLIMVPFAYLNAIYIKLLILLRSKKRNE